MKRIDIVHECPIFRNPRPGHQAVSAFYSNLVPISDEEMVCCTRLGQALCSADQRLIIQRTTDGGKTWQYEGLVRNSEKDLPKNTYNIGMIIRRKDGQMIILACRRGEHFFPASFDIFPGTQESSTMAARAHERAEDLIASHCPAVPEDRL